MYLFRLILHNCQTTVPLLFPHWSNLTHFLLFTWSTSGNWKHLPLIEGRTESPKSTLHILRLSKEQSQVCLHLKVALSISGNLMTNSLDNALHSTSRFAADSVRKGIKGTETCREVWIRIKQNVLGKNYKVKKPFVHTMEHNFLVDTFKLVFYHTLFFCKISCVVLKWISFCPNQWISPLTIIYSPS